MARYSFSDPARPIVCVQGLGFVGAAMAVSIAAARDGEGKPFFNVIGVDLPVGAGLYAIVALNEGRFPSASTDANLLAATKAAHVNGNLVATDDASAYGLAEVIVCDVNLDLAGDRSAPDVHFERFEAAIRTIGRMMRAGALVIVETTLPPGTCARVVAPALADELERRGEDPHAFLLAHSFERVMPGADYLHSIINYWRVYAGHTPPAAAACRTFLEKVVNTRDFPLTELASITASEIAKVMENSYRAVNIAFIEEWARFAEAVGIDLFEVIAAIRQRPTHSNIRQPGFGVGGYCLTKDPLFAKVAARRLFGREDLEFPFCERALEINDAMPLVSLERLERMLGGLHGRHIALFGVSYRQDVGDTRHSPSETFVRAALERGAIISAHDPLVRRWEEMAMDIDPAPPAAAGIDAAVFAVPHGEYRSMDLAAWAGTARPAVLDANAVLSPAQRSALRAAGCRVEVIGVGAQK
jgi:UDP-N-acetyl-D-glucosamine dehydrogenase